jgi:NADPH2:quinone reductase
MMRAVWVPAFGPPEVLEMRSGADPEPGPDEVVVAVAAVSVTFIDTAARAGRMPGRSVPPPYVPGNGVGGSVTLCGEGVDPSWLGRRVVTQTGGTGGYASLVAVPAAGLIAVPDAVSLNDATALLADGRTAVGLFEAASPQPGDRVLVLAAAGGVGSLLVQLGANAGATVVAAAGDAHKLDLARSLGATQAVDYAELPVVDVAFDGVGGVIGAAALRAVRPGGRFVQYGLASGAPTVIDRDDVTVLGFAVLGAIAPRAATLSAQALDLAAAGKLRPVVGQTFPLDEAAAAHRAIEARATVGKTLLIP